MEHRARLPPSARPRSSVSGGHIPVADIVLVLPYVLRYTLPGSLHPAVGPGPQAQGVLPLPRGSFPGAHGSRQTRRLAARAQTYAGCVICLNPGHTQQTLERRGVGFSAALVTQRPNGSWISVPPPGLDPDQTTTNALDFTIMDLANQTQASRLAWTQNATGGFSPQGARRQSTQGPLRRTAPSCCAFVTTGRRGRRARTRAPSECPSPSTAG